MLHPCRAMLVLSASGLLALSVLLAPAGADQPEAPSKKIPAARNADAAPFLESRWTRPTIVEKQTEDWVLKEAVALVEGRGQAAIPAAVPLVVGGKVVYRSYWGLHAVNLQTGKLEWEADSRWSLDRLVHDNLRSTTLTQWVSGHLSAGQASMLLENSVLGNLATDGKRVFAVEDLTVPPYVPQNQQFFPGQPQPGPVPGFTGALTDAIVHNRLQAFDLATGKLVWEQGGRAARSELADSHFLAAPLLLDGKLYAPVEKEGELRIACLDPVKGDVLWTFTLANYRARITQTPLRRLHAAQLAYGDGILVCPTGAGAVIGLDLESRTLAWVHTYRDLEVVPPPPEEGDQIFQLQMQRQRPRPQHTWKATPPLIHNGRVLFAPADGSTLVCLKLHDGDVAWRLRAGPEDLYLGGVDKRRVLVVGKKTCRALDLGDGKPVWQVDTGLPSGRGVLHDHVYYLPLRTAVASHEPEVCAIDVEQGVVLAHTLSRKREIPGNLVLADGHVLSQTAGTVAAYPQLSARLRQLDEQIEKEPKDAALLGERGDLRLARGDMAGAVADLRASLANKPAEAVREQTRARLYEALTALLERDFTAGEQFLAEYEELCKVPVPADLPVTERHALEVEGQRRQAKLAFLIAHGREQQGKTIAALRGYLDYAALAVNEEQVSVPDEPILKAPRSTWLAGHIPALLAAVAHDKRQLLEAEIERKGQALIAAKDAAKLANFVRVLGGTAPGREARLALAELLVKDNAFLEAEQQLLHVRRQQDDPARAGAALEALARLYLHRGLAADAASCYRALGRDFATIAVRDGKTGADLLRDAGSDKRLVSFLEEASPIRRAKVQVAELAGTYVPNEQVYAFEPQGEVLPFFRSHTVGTDVQLHQFRLSERGSHRELWRQPLTRTQFGNLLNNGNPNDPVRLPCHLSGHLVVLSLGHLVFALDPIGHRLLWEKSLLGRESAPGGANLTIDPQDGRPQFVYPDGLVQKLGQRGPLTTTCFYFQTTDGLAALDPLTGGVLWSRDDVDPQGRIFADDDYVFVVTANGTRAFRARDGVSVKVPDCSALFPRRLATLGRRLLLAAAGGDGLVLRLYDPLTGADVWRKTYPAGSRLLTSEEPESAGAVEPDGKVSVVSTATGKEMLSAHLDREHLAGVQQIRMVRDAVHVYLLLSTAPDPKLQPYGGVLSNLLPGTGLRSIPVNGWVYAFDRGSGQIAWRAEAPNQHLVLEQSAEMPFLVFTSRHGNRGAVLPNGQPAQVVALRVMDKRTGKLVYDQTLNQNVQPFHAVMRDDATETVELVAYSLKVRLTLEK
jgi:outer membrane protein assembly factor BamB/tetratricopeptide (TPR) repeat protein